MSRGGGVRDRRDVLDFMHGRSRTTIDPRIPTMPGRSMSGFHRPGRHCLHRKSRGGGGRSEQGIPNTNSRGEQTWRTLRTISVKYYVDLSVCLSLLAGMSVRLYACTPVCLPAQSSCSPDCVSVCPTVSLIVCLICRTITNPRRHREYLLVHAWLGSCP